MEKKEGRKTQRFFQYIEIYQYLEDIFMSFDSTTCQSLYYLSDRLYLASQTNARQEVYSYLYGFKEPYDLKILVVGDQGSYPAAICVSHSLREKLLTADVEAVTSPTAIQLLTKRPRAKYDVVIGLFHKGFNSLNIRVCEESNRRDIPFVLFTGQKKEEVHRHFEEEHQIVISYYNPDDKTGDEKGIPMFSTLAPAILFDDYPCYISMIKGDGTVYNNPSAFANGPGFSIYRRWLDKSAEFATKLNYSVIYATLIRYPVIHVFYDWKTYAVAVDISNKFMQAGIANVVLHERQEFQYGNYAVLTRPYGMVINLGESHTDLKSYIQQKPMERTDYERELDWYLMKSCEKDNPRVDESIFLQLGNEQLQYDDTGDSIAKLIIK